MPPIDRPLLFFEIEGDTIWGATGAMLRNFLALVTGTRGGADPGSVAPRPPAASRDPIRGRRRSVGSDPCRSRDRPTAGHRRRPVSADLDPDRFATHWFDGRGFRQAYVHEGIGGVPVLLVHGWPETKRIWWRVIEPLADAGFEVIVPDLRGFGESERRPRRLRRHRRQAATSHALVDHLGHDASCSSAATSAGAIIQDIAAALPRIAPTAWCCSTRRCPT